MLWAVGFLVTFLFGGLTGVILASPPLDFQLSDSYFVVAHFHYVVFGTVVFAMFGGFYFWWPKITGRMLDERLGKIHFWLLFIGFHTTFLVQHWLGVEGMPRRYADYKPTDGFTTLNEISSIGAFVLGASTLPFLYNVWKSRRRRWSASTTRGAGAARSSGPRRARRRGTTSSSCRGSAPRARPSTCTTPRSRCWSSSDNDQLNVERRLADTPEMTAARASGRADRRRAAAGRRRRRGGPPVKVEAWIFGINAVFFALVTPSYWLFTGDPTGTAALVMTTLLAALVTFYLGFHANKMDAAPRGPQRRRGRRRCRRARASSRRTPGGRCGARSRSRSACSASSSAGGCSSSASAPARSP